MFITKKHCTLYFHLTAFTPLKWHITVTIEDAGITGMWHCRNGSFPTLWWTVVLSKELGATNPVSVSHTSWFSSAVSLIILCFLLAYMEPYCLRLQHRVMCYYYPDRARQRSAWLYNHILTMRGSFLKFAKRQLRRKFGEDKEDVNKEASIMDRLQHQWV